MPGTNDMNELKPCPFCGSRAYTLIGANYKDEEVYSVECGEENLEEPEDSMDACILQGTKYYYEAQDAIDAWNKRVP